MIQIGLMVPGSSEGSGLDEIFEYKLSKLNEEESDKHFIGAEITAFPKWLCTPLGSAPFKNFNAEQRVNISLEFYKDWRGTICSAKKKSSRRCARS
jgi:hypothetical protein